VLNLVIVKKGDNGLPGLTDIEKPRIRGPRRASKIRKLFNLTKDDDFKSMSTHSEEISRPKVARIAAKLPEFRDCAMVLFITPD
jgi:small subunit ribosomal protein S6e